MNRTDIMTAFQLMREFEMIDKVKDLPDSHIPHIVEGLKIFKQYMNICRLYESCLTESTITIQISHKIHEELGDAKILAEQFSKYAPDSLTLEKFENFSYNRYENY